MRLGIIVTDFPKITETFILRDLLEFHRRGHEVRIYHMTRFRKNEVVHEFARPTLAWARPQAYLFSRPVLGALARALIRHPLRLLAIVARICWGYRREPVLLAKSLFIVPESLACAEDLVAWDAAHVHAEFAGHPGTCAWIVGRMTGLPYSVSCRAHDIFRTQSLLDTKLGEAACVRTITAYNKRFLLEHVSGLAERPLAVVHSSVPTQDMPALAPPAGEPFRVLYVGSLQVRKGVDVLLRSLANASDRLGDWTCDILGGGPEAERLRGLAEELGLQDRVRFAGPQPFEDVARAYADAHVIVAPSIIGPQGRTEGIPNVVIEGLAHQRPVIATSVSGIPELVTDGETGTLVAPGDVDALAAALVRVRRDPCAAYRMAVRGRQRVEAEFDLRTNVEAQLQAFARYRAAEAGQVIS